MSKLNEMTDEELALAYVRGDNRALTCCFPQRGETVLLYPFRGSR